MLQLTGVRVDNGVFQLKYDRVDSSRLKLEVTTSLT
jgi:hypothetical protein